MFARKILPKISLLCVLALVKSQNYDYSADEGGTESEAQEQTPDYSKYFSVAPTDGVSSFAGFTQPQTAFSYEPYEVFGASTQDKKKVNINQAFAPLQAAEPTGFAEFFSKNIYPGNQDNQKKDYFEQAQTKKQEENQEENQEEPSDEISDEKEEQNEEESDEKLESNQDDPKYISHEIPTKIPHQVETVKVKENLRVNNYKYVNPSTQETQQSNYKTPQNHAVDFKYLPHLQPLTSQHGELYPQASGIHNLPLQTLPLTPYQKYSFQPIGKQQNKYLENLNSASDYVPKSSKSSSTIESQESKVQPKAVDRKNCIKMKRNSGDKHIADLTCYVCENKETNSKVTECAYQSEPDSTDLVKGSSERYSVPAKNDAFRYRRATSEEEDPYEYVKQQSLKAQNEKENIDDLYSFAGYEETQPEKSYSEIQSEEILKDAKKCTDVQKDGMSCRVCKDPASGGNFESCSYTSAPKPDKYAYVSEKNYNSNDDPKNANEEGESKNVPVNADVSSSSQRNRKQSNNEENSNENTRGLESKQLDHVYASEAEKEDVENEQNEKSEYPFSESNDEAETKQDTENNEKENQEESDEQKEASEDESPYSDIGEYKFKYFPEFSLPTSEKEEPLDYEASSRKEVEDVLADFKKRDRSQCQQTKKNGMTCFLCIGENKVKNEECMFISESKPKGTIAKYTKANGIVSTNSKPAESKEVLGESETKRKDVVAAASSEVETRVKAPSRRGSKRYELKASASAPDSQRLEESDDEPKLKTPVEFQTTDEGGAYSAETKPVYSKTLGMTLPQYMLEKSEFEKEFDASSKYNY